ncbi:unnamed protein product, partial [Prorocentrum cordatum]
ASMDLDALLERAADLGNHPSFYELRGRDRPPGVEQLQRLVNQGFGILFEDRAAAEAFYSTAVFPAPLGNITRTKPDGATKHRIIQDLKVNLVNSAVTLAERQVLPTIIDHALDVALLSSWAQEGGVSWTLALDFADAFMSVPLHPDEQPFNCAHVGHALRRDRPPAYPQALLRPFARSGCGRAAAAAGRLQLYVDDPVLTVAGTPAAAQLAIDLALTWWPLLGVPLAWKKGALYAREHLWIGAMFIPYSPGEVHVMLPTEFLADLFRLLEPFAAGSGHASVAAARRVVGKCARVAYVVPDAAPFAAALWGALAGAAAADREAPPGRVARRRFGAAARWMRALVNPSGLDLLPLRRVVRAQDEQRGRASDAVVKFDASPWGGGAALYRRGVPVEFFALTWSDDVCGLFNVGTGPHHMIAGDNVAALEGALDFRGKGLLNHITREIAWRRARRRWEYVVSHLPAEHNETADALSRPAAPDPAELPAELTEAERVGAPSVPEFQ